jgi:hypothetical protein
VKKRLNTKRGKKKKMGAKVSRDEYTEVVYVNGNGWCIGLSMHEGANFEGNFGDLIGRVKSGDVLRVSGDQPYTEEAEKKIELLLAEAQGLPVDLTVMIDIENGAGLMVFLYTQLQGRGCKFMVASKELKRGKAKEGMEK